MKFPIVLIVVTFLNTYAYSQSDSSHTWTIKPDTTTNHPSSVNARFKGDLGLFISENFKCSRKAMLIYSGEKVYVKFTIMKDGSVKGVKILKGLSPEINEAAKNAVKATSGHWEPGWEDGRPVRSRKILPIKISAEK